MNDFLTYMLGGGFVSALLGLFTLRSKIKKILAETESLNLDNSEKATEILMNNIVEPLKQELHETRKEMALLRAAILDTKRCRLAMDCPVLARLREHKDNGTKADHYGSLHDDLQPRSAARRSPDGPDT